MRAIRADPFISPSRISDPQISINIKNALLLLSLSTTISDQWSVYVIVDQQYDLLYKFITFEIGLNMWKIAGYKLNKDMTNSWQTDDNNSGDWHRVGSTLVSVYVQANSSIRLPR